MVRSRSLIFIPGNNQRFLDKSKTINSDIICFDLEDSVPLTEKETARGLVKKTINEISRMQELNKKIVAVRINNPQSEMAKTDLNSIITKGLDLIVIPKVGNEYEIKKISKMIEEKEVENKIENKIGIMPSIESALGVVNAYNIAKADQRISALVFGIFDLLHDMKIDNYDDEFLTSYMYSRAKVPVDARAAGIDAIDAIWQNINDTEGLTKDSIFGKKLGYSGRCIIHPSQIDHVHRVFRASQQDIEWAQKVISTLDNASNKKTGKIGAVNLEGKMIDAVHYKQAKRILDSIDL